MRYIIPNRLLYPILEICPNLLICWLDAFYINVCISFNSFVYVCFYKKTRYSRYKNHLPSDFGKLLFCWYVIVVIHVLYFTFVSGRWKSISVNISNCPRCCPRIYTCIKISCIMVLMKSVKVKKTPLFTFTCVIVRLVVNRCQIQSVAQLAEHLTGDSESVPSLFFSFRNIWCGANPLNWQANSGERVWELWSTRI